MRFVLAVTSSVVVALSICFAAASAAQQPDQPTFRVFDRIDASDNTRWIVVDGILAPLAPGDYAIEVTLDGTARVTAIRIKP